MKKLFLSGLLLIAGAMTVKAQVSADLSAKLNTAFDDACSSNKIKGASIAIFIPGEGVWKRAYGESYAGHSITTDMVFQINNNTQTLVAALMMKALEMGKIQLSDTIGTWIKGYRNISGKITIEQLLTHRSGLNDYSYNMAYIGTVEKNFTNVWPHDGALQFLDPPVDSAGASFMYSNTNYVLAALVLEKVFQQPLATSLHQYILDPAGLTHTYLVPDQTVSDPKPHIWNAGMASTEQIDFMEWFNYSDIQKQSLNFGSGNIISTAEDNAAFWHLLQSGQIVNHASWTFMTQKVNISHQITQGVSIFKYPNFNGHPAYGFGGKDVGYTNENVVDSVSGVSISILTNQDSIDNSILLKEIIGGLHRTILDFNTTGINTLKNESLPGLSIYPNPATDLLQVYSTGNVAPVSITLYDMSGRLTYSGRVNPGESISVNNFSDGLYIARLQQAGQLQPVITRVQISH